VREGRTEDASADLQSLQAGAAGRLSGLAPPNSRAPSLKPSEEDRDGVGNPVDMIDLGDAPTVGAN